MAQAAAMSHKHNADDVKPIYLYRAVDRAGNTVDFRLSPRRDVAAAKAFFRKAIKGQGSGPRQEFPGPVSTGSGVCPARDCWVGGLEAATSAVVRFTPSPEASRARLVDHA